MQSLSAFLVVWSLEKNSFFICYLAVPQQTVGSYQGDSHCYPMLIGTEKKIHNDDMPSRVFQIILRVCVEYPSPMGENRKCC